jgi:hypothetical protein
MAYEPRLPDGLPTDLKIDTSSAPYKALEALATREKWTQAAFSDVLGIEARRVMATAPKAAPAPAAPAPEPKPDFSKMTTREKFAYGLANPTRSYRGQS